MSQEHLLNKENSNFMQGVEQQNNSNLNNNLLEREKKFQRMKGIVKDNEMIEKGLKNENETGKNIELRNNEIPKNMKNYKEKNSSDLFLCKFFDYFYFKKLYALNNNKI